MTYWNRAFQLGADSLGRILLIVEVVFAFLTLFGLLGLFLGTLLLKVKRRQDLERLPIASMLGSQLSFMGRVLIEAINCILIIRSTKVMGYYYIGQIIEEFCIHVTFCLLFYVFSELICQFHQRTIDSSKRSSRLKSFVWTTLAIIVALSVADWGYYIYLTDASVLAISNPSSYSDNIYWTWARIAAVRCIVFLVASVGIASQAIVMTLRMRSRPSKISAYLLLQGAVFFFAWNLLWAIWAIRWYLASNTQNTIESTYMARAIAQCFLCLGTYLGLMLYCSKYWDESPSWDPASQAGMGFASSPPIAEVEASRGVFEADSKHPVPEVDTSRPIVEADTNPVVEADSKQLTEKE